MPTTSQYESSVCANLQRIAPRTAKGYELDKKGEHRMMMDLNEGERLHQRVRESLLAGIIGSAMDAIIAIDDAQRIVLFNAAAEKIFVCTANEAVGSSVERFIPQRFRDGHSTRVRRFAESGVTNRTLQGLGTLWGLRATGEEFPIEASISKVESEGKNFFTVVIRDITERQRAEEAVRESEQRFRLVADTAPVLMWMSSTDKLCTYFNKTWLDFTGRSIGQELGSGWAEGVHPDDLQRCLQTYEESFDRREEFRMEYRLRRHDGEYRWILDIGVPRFDQNRSFVGYIGIGVDVTEHKQAEEALQKSEERFRMAAQAGRMFAYEWDVATDVIVRSPEAAKIVGMDEGAQITGQQILAWVHPNDRERLTAAVTALSQEKPDLKISYRIRRPDGTVIWVDRNSRAYFDEQGRMLRVVGMVVDITERKLAEEMLRESEEQFRTLAEAIPQLCWMARGDGHIFWYNQRWYTYTGTTLEQMEGWGWQSVHDPQTLPNVLERWKASLSTGEPFDMVFPLRGVDGVFRPFLTRVMPIKDTDRRVVRWFGTNTDITELRDAQEALLTSEERLRLAQKAARIGSFEWNIETGANIWTPELEAMYGLAPGDFDKTQATFENLVHPDDRGRVIGWVDEALKTGRPNKGEWRVVWPDGSVHWIAGRWQAFMNQSGEAMRVIGVNMDVTDQKRAEEALSAMTQRLIEAQEHERARIARELHDDVNQRVALLSIELDDLRLKRDDLPPEVRDRMQELQLLASDILNDLHALSHELHSSKLDCLGVVRAMTSWCKEFGDHQRLKIDFKSQHVPKLSQEISISLFRVLQEAVHNAAKHSGAKRIEVQLVENSGEIHLNVSDSGKGFDIEAAGQSQGLGLTSMRERVRLVGGTIAIGSKSTGGTTIHVRVPLKQGSQLSVKAQRV